ncbi:MAG: hypothetical protein IJ054_00350, partial [Lachnospiraceae bacterium]|nr:hypothetical protein [Lachnospiraceae bacterium]
IQSLRLIPSHHEVACPRQLNKKNCNTVVSDGDNLSILEFYAVGNYLKAVLFMLSRVAELLYDLKYLQFSRFI